jgi:peptidoglycan/xylan/chitin deacetylase (PgdA/CDA1 family)
MNIKHFVLLIVALLTLAGCNGGNQAAQDNRNNMNGKLRAQSEAKTTPHLLAGSENSQRQPHPLSLADLHQKYKSTFLFSGPPSKREVALTFDDVPDLKFTPQVLDMLKKSGVKATFFVVGNRAEAHPEIVKRMIQEGHVIGNHSYNHPNLPKVSDDVFHDQILRTENILADIAGYRPKLFRPPYGNVNEKQIEWLASQQYHIINWNVDSLDWKGLNADQVVTNVVSHVTPGSIVLQHGAGGAGEDLTGTVQALPIMIERLQSKGIKLVTIPELFGIPAGT